MSKPTIQMPQERRDLILETVEAAEEIERLFKALLTTSYTRSKKPQMTDEGMSETALGSKISLNKNGEDFVFTILDGTAETKVIINSENFSAYRCKKDQDSEDVDQLEEMSKDELLEFCQLIMALKLDILDRMEKSKREVQRMTNANKLPRKTLSPGTIATSDFDVTHRQSNRAYAVINFASSIFPENQKLYDYNEAKTAIESAGKRADLEEYLARNGFISFSGLRAAKDYFLKNASSMNAEQKAAFFEKTFGGIHSKYLVKKEKEVVKTPPTLKAVIESEITPELQETINRIRENDPTLTKINFSQYRTSTVILKHLIDILRENKTLKKVDLSYSQIGISDEELQQIAAVLKENKTIKSIDLSGDTISDEGVKYLAEAFRENKTLTAISLDYNKVSDEGAKHIAAALQENQTLTKIYLNANEISVEILSEIDGYLERNRRLAEENEKQPKSDEKTDEDLQERIAVLEKQQEELTQQYNLLYTQQDELQAQDDSSDKISSENSKAKDEKEKLKAEEFRNLQQQHLKILELQEKLSSQQQALSEKHDELGDRTFSLEQQARLTAEELEGKIKELAANLAQVSESSKNKPEIIELQQNVFDLQRTQELLSNQQKENQDQLEQLQKQIGDFNAANLDPWIYELKLKPSQISALNKVEGFRLEELNEFGVKETYDDLQENNQRLKSIIEQQHRKQEEAIKRIKNSGDNFYTVTDPINKPYFEQIKLESDPRLQKAALAIRAKFNEHLLVSVALGSDKLQGTTGKRTTWLGYASVLIGEIPFGSVISDAASSISAYIGETRRANRYEKLGDLIKAKDISSGNALAEKIGRKIVLTGEVKILEDLAKLKNEKDIEKYYKKLAKSCLENVLNGNVEKSLEEIFGNKNPNEDDLIKAIGVRAGVIHRNHSIYEITSEEAKKIADSSAQKLPQTVDVNQLFELVMQMRDEMKELRTENEGLKRRISELEQPSNSPSVASKKVTPLSSSQANAHGPN